MRKPVPELAMPGWTITEERVRHMFGQPAHYAVFRAIKPDVAEYHVALMEQDATAVSRQHAIAALMIALCKFEADPGAYFKAQYEKRINAEE